MKETTCWFPNQMVGSSDVGSKVWLSYFDLAQGIGHYKWRLGSSQEHRVTKRTLDMGGGKAFLILCILLFIPSEGLVVSNTPKPNDPRTIGKSLPFFLFIYKNNLCFKRISIFSVTIYLFNFGFLSRSTAITWYRCVPK